MHNLYNYYTDHLQEVKDKLRHDANEQRRLQDERTEQLRMKMLREDALRGMARGCNHYHSRSSLGSGIMGGVIGYELGNLVDSIIDGGDW